MFVFRKLSSFGVNHVFLPQARETLPLATREPPPPPSTPFLTTGVFRSFFLMRCVPPGVESRAFPPPYWPAMMTATTKTFSISDDGKA